MPRAEVELARERQDGQESQRACWREGSGREQRARKQAGWHRGLIKRFTSLRRFRACIGMDRRAGRYEALHKMAQVW